MADNYESLGLELNPSESSFSMVSDMSSVVSDSRGTGTAISAVPEDESQTPPVKHAKYFIKDRQVTFKVEGTLFRVHRFFFVRDSEYFRKLLGDTNFDEEGDQEWSGSVGLDAESICLDDEGVKSVDFERFLDVLYPSDYGKHSLSSLDEWTSVLHLASKWGFETMRALAVREVYPLAPAVDKIVLGHKYDIQDWLFGAYVAICARAEALTPDEGRRLGVDDVVQISAFRQSLRPHSGAIKVDELEHGVRRIFVPGGGPTADRVHDSLSSALDDTDLGPVHDSSSSELPAVTATPTTTLPSKPKQAPCPDALRLIAEMIESMSFVEPLPAGKFKGSLVLPLIAAEATSFYAGTITDLARFLVNSVEDSPHSINKYAKICVYLSKHIRHNASGYDSDGYDSDDSRYALSPAKSFMQDVLQFGLTLRTYAVPNGAEHFPCKLGVLFIAAVWPTLSQAPLEEFSKLVNTGLNAQNVEYVCELLGIMIQNCSYNGGSTFVDGLVDRILAVTRKLHWKSACCGEALEERWVAKRGSTKTGW